ncbi:T9SS type A sorting domain-containing protein [Dyadobacter diqingensis]|uniref:T9SS type A sorting domain-containing protein n=1 Tax=Dyadobacter diqingensis TaxID=2938121 RepID=UPI0020C1A3BB|nr:T9SS type A sorting domain-containing protein [Dyadobacter diqingensis]
MNWSTPSETNSDHFEIQRSIDGKDWNKIDVKGLPAGVYMVKITRANGLRSTQQVVIGK